MKLEPTFRQLFERVLFSSGIKMKGYVAVQRKLLVLIYTLYKNDITYDPNHLNKKSEIEKSKQNCRQDTSPAYSGCLL